MNLDERIDQLEIVSLNNEGQPALNLRYKPEIKQLISDVLEYVKPAHIDGSRIAARMEDKSWGYAASDIANKMIEYMEDKIKELGL